MSVNIPATDQPRIVVVGGGFGGLQVIKGLKNIDAQVIWIDKNNYHNFQALLYQVATAGLEPDSIVYPLRKIIKKYKNTIFRMTEVLAVRPDENCLETTIGRISYDYLVLASGSNPNFFGKEDIQKHAVPMKTVPQALDLRSLILQNFEKALEIDQAQEREKLMNFVIVGGGPTGVEMAGALGELKHHILPKDYPDLDFKKMQIHIIEMKDRLLSFMPVDLSRSAERFLKKFDINIWLNTQVIAYDGNTALLSNGKKLEASTMIWTAGVMGEVIPGLKPEVILPLNRIKVDVFNKVEGSPNIFAIGDVAGMITQQTLNGHPMLAPIAIQQGRHLAKNLKRLIQQKPMVPFVYRDLGVMATVGRSHAVCDLNFIKFQGFIGWFVWLFVHLMLLVGFRSKVVTFINWFWSYISYDRGLRLIIRPYKKLNKE